MGAGPFPLLWLCGPSGVGKSTVGWEIYTQLGREGVQAGYLDADQLGLSFPVPDDDPPNHRVKARNLGAVWPNFRSAGARCLIVSGILESPEAVRIYADSTAGTAWTLCRLRVGHPELRERILRRGWLTHLADDSVRDAEALERGDFADLCVDTGGLSAAEVARRVRERTGWPVVA
ncbi:AAA family ATPase [Amycolatopsis anabasis]|uniref:AAA family ATPase n=1 Tax=Amycolatopsis anabasis TaxID=1840409 RepID=UPI00131EBA8C|nr:AAA family ATPase [Amycolatopsis anabasis]